jgi:hypothetical protein
MQGRFAPLLLALTPALAADHVDAPNTLVLGNRGADITDVFLFRSPENPAKLVGAICLGGVPAPAPVVTAPAYDPDAVLLYQLDVNRDTNPDFTIAIRFGQNSLGAFGVELENLPGAGTRYVFGPIEQVLESPTGLKVYAGYRDDPFFFDVEGFRATFNSFGDDSAPDGSLMFDSARDSFGFRNLTAVVFEMDLATVAQNYTEIRAWATSGKRAD